MSFSSKIALSFFLSLSFLLPSVVFGGVICEDLPQELCAFSISSTSKRCVLESVPHEGGGAAKYQCRTSEVVVAKMSNWIETDDCVMACGLHRSTVGISSDTLLEPQFMAKLCSDDCYLNCPNIVDLYFNLAAGEGVFLPELCSISLSNPRRSISEVGFGAPASAPAP